MYVALFVGFFALGIFVLVLQPRLRGRRLRACAARNGWRYIESVPEGEAMAAGFLGPFRTMRAQYHVRNLLLGTATSPSSSSHATPEAGSGALSFAFFDARIQLKGGYRPRRHRGTQLEDGHLRVELPGVELPPFVLEPRSVVQFVVDALSECTDPEVPLARSSLADKAILRAATPAAARLFEERVGELCEQTPRLRLEGSGNHLWLYFGPPQLLAPAKVTDLLSRGLEIAQAVRERALALARA